jgi:hypothetical protein
MGTAGPAQEHGKGGGLVGVRGGGHGRGTDPGAVDVGGALFRNRGGAGTDTWAAVGEAAGPVVMGST